MKIQRFYSSIVQKIDFCRNYLLSGTVTFQAYYAKTRRATCAWFCQRTSHMFFCITMYPLLMPLFNPVPVSWICVQFLVQHRFHFAYHSSELLSSLQREFLEWNDREVWDFCHSHNARYWQEHAWQQKPTTMEAVWWCTFPPIPR